MAFTDELIANSDAEVIMVDRAYAAAQGAGTPHRSGIAGAVGRTIANTRPAIENLERIMAAIPNGADH